MKHKVMVTLVLFVVLMSCKGERLDAEAKQDLLQILEISNCDSLLNNDVFKKHSRMQWPDEKPSDVLDAVKKFDLMTNEFHDHCLNVCSPGKFYFGFAMGMRNEWYHDGTPEFRNQIDKKLGLHFELSSGFVLSLYMKWKNEEKVDFWKEFSQEYADNLSDVAVMEYKKIQKEINALM